MYCTEPNAGPQNVKHITVIVNKNFIKFTSFVIAKGVSYNILVLLLQVLNLYRPLKMYKVEFKQNSQSLKGWIFGLSMYFSFIELGK